MSSVTIDTLANSDVVKRDREQSRDPSHSTTDHTWTQPVCSAPEVIEFTENDLSDEKFLGSGGFGKVFRRKWRSSNYTMTYVAEKRMIPGGSLENEAICALKHEASMLASINHSHVIKLLGILHGDNKFSLVMEFMENGSCYDFFRSLPKAIATKDKWPLKFRISKEVCEAMEFLHSMKTKVLHLDLKARNVLLDHELNVKLCDFGLSSLKTLSRITQASAKALASEQTTGGRKNVAGGTITHIAPEHLREINKPPTTKSDVYSYGVLLWELLTDAEPYQGPFQQNLVRGLVIGGQRPDMKLVSQDAPKILKVTMKQSWEDDPDERPEFSEILEELSRKPTLYSDDRIRESVQIILDHKQLHSGITHSDSQFLMSSSRRGPFPGTTRSEGESRAVRRPNQRPRPFSSFDPDETAVKKPVQPRSSGQRLSNFATQPLTSSVVTARTRPSTESTSQAPSTLLTSEDVLISDITDDTQPLVEVAGQSEDIRVSRRRRCILIVFGILILVGVAVFVTLTLVYGWFGGGHCPVLKAGQHQTLSCSPPVRSGHTEVKSGTKCNVSCGEGFGIKDGKSQLTCQMAGRWSDKLPTCSQLKTCQSLVEPANGGKYQCTDKFYEMSVCTFTCPAGYRLHLPRVTLSNLLPLAGVNELNTTCSLGSTTWTIPEPYCEKVVTCEQQLPQIPAGSYDCKQPSGAVSIDRVKSSSFYSNGTICKLTCEKGFGALGPSVFLCGQNGNWNVTTSPSCVTECPPLNKNFNGSFTCTHATFATSVCTFSCQTNYVQLGPLSISCLTDGSWTNKQPECICPPCMTGAHCDKPSTWKDVTAKMNIEKQTFYYGDHPIKCYKREFLKKYHPFGVEKIASMMSYDDVTTNVTSSCVCRDVPSNLMKQCNEEVSLQETCTSTLATLILNMAYKGLYPLPCDANLMPQPCSTKN